MNPIPDFIGVYQKEIPGKVCEEIIHFFEANPHLHQNRQLAQNSHPHDIKDTFFFLQEENYLNTLRFFLRGALHKYTQDYPAFSGYLEPENNLYIDSFKIQKTNPSEGYHGWHHEVGNKSVTDRVLVYTIYLNNIKEGGETEFLYQQKRISPNVGDICFFPPYFTHTHRGNPPIKNSKYIVTGWFNIGENYFNHKNLLT